MEIRQQQAWREKLELGQSGLLPRAQAYPRPGAGVGFCQPLRWHSGCAPWHSRGMAPPFSPDQHVFASKGASQVSGGLQQRCWESFLCLPLAQVVCLHDLHTSWCLRSAPPGSPVVLTVTSGRLGHSTWLLSRWVSLREAEVLAGLRECHCPELL